MLRITLFALITAGLLFGLDYYVYRNWRAYVLGYRRRLRWSLPVYKAFMALMPFTMPLYFSLSNWWEVEPKLARALMIGLWVVYYLPKVLVVLGLMVKDFVRFVIWLFEWFRAQLSPAEAATTPLDLAPTPAAPRAPQAEGEAPPLDLSDMNRLPRRDFLREMGWTAASVPFVVVGYGVFRTLYDFSIYEIDVPIQGLPRALDGLRIAQLSDLHAGSLFSARPMEEAVDLIHSYAPDLVTITGDFVNHDDAELPLIEPALRRLQADLGVYGCLGNHDHYANVQAVIGRLGNTNVDLLVNQARTLEIDGAHLHLVGTDNTGFNQHHADLSGALAARRRHAHGDEATVLLAHDPTFWDMHVRHEAPDVDLMLSGHTHGGQIGFERGPLRWSLARIAYPRWAGRYEEHQPTDEGARQYLYVNRGLGTVGPPIRLGINPEVTLLTLRRA